MARVLVLLSGYPCARAPWGNSQNHGTPNSTLFDSFYAGAKYHHKLLAGHDVDYICVTWDEIGTDVIKNTYNPILFNSYSQEQFRNQVSEKLDEYEKNRMELRTQYYSEHKLNNELVVSSIRFASQLQSRCYAANMAIEQINKSSTKYDAILISRYDISCRGGFRVRHPSVLEDADIAFLNSTQNSPKFIIPAFNQLNCGLPDMWIYTNTNGLIYYSKIFENYVSDITSNHSEYFRMMTEGWPNSRFFPIHSIYDYNQYSNEILSGEKSLNLMKYPDWEVSNLHSYHKYFLLLSSSLPKGSELKFKNTASIIKAFLKASSISKNGIGVIKEFIQYVRFLKKILLDRLKRLTSVSN